ncbi:MAG: hypothetical protein Q9227_009137 [Pyrenula ochraceoflavens]
MCHHSFTAPIGHIPAASYQIQFESLGRVEALGQQIISLSPEMLCHRHALARLNDELSSIRSHPPSKTLASARKIWEEQVMGLEEVVAEKEKELHQVEIVAGEKERAIKAEIRSRKRELEKVWREWETTWGGNENEVDMMVEHWS